ncbi:hypothetical protein D3C80_1276060 [compost metagenome]
MPRHQPGVELRHQDETQGIAAEQPAVVLGRYAVQLDEDEGRTGDVGEHPGDGQAAGQRMTEKRPIAEQPPVFAQRAAQGRLGRVGRQGFRQPQRHTEPAEHAEGEQAGEDRLPAEPAEERAAGQRREDRRQAHDQHQLGKYLGRGDRIAQVAHHGSIHHHAGAAAEGLDETRDYQPFQTRRQGAGQRGQTEQQHSGEQRLAPAEPIGQGPIYQLPQRQADEVGG